MTADADLFKLGTEPVKSRKAATLGEAGYERRPRDAYFTPGWVTRALVKYIDFHPVTGGDPGLIWEPAVGDGRIADVLRAAGYDVVGSDIHDYGWSGTYLIDFLRFRQWPFRELAGAIVTNPPFDIAREFVVRALELTRPARGKAAILQRHEFDAPRSNHDLFRLTGGIRLVLHKRPKWSDEDKASPRFPFCWYVFDWRADGAWRTLWCYSRGQRPLVPEQRHALDMIADKVARILAGDPQHTDHWLDIGGYAALAAKAEPLPDGQVCALGAA